MHTASHLGKNRIKALVTGLILLLGAGSTQGRPEEWIYTVRPGDNLWNLAEEYLIDLSYWQKLQTLNRVEDPFHIPPGTRLRIPTSWLKKTPILARVQSVTGTAEAVEADTGKVTPLQPGNLLLMGDAVRTGKDTNITLEFVDGSRLLLQSDSYLTLDHLGIYRGTGVTDTRVRLRDGRLETQVAPAKGAASRFQISTPAAITSVRGTDYRVGSDIKARESRAEVTQGRVDVSSAGTTRDVPAGFGTIAAAGEAPRPPIRLLAAPDLSGLPETFERSPIQFVLAAAPEIRGYRVQIAEVPEIGARLLFDETFSSERIRGPDLPDGEYLLRGRGIDTHALEGLNAERRFVLNARPEPPLPLEPKPGAGVQEESPIFEWSRQENIRAYHFQLARDPRFAKNLVDRGDYPDTRLAVDRKLAPGLYFWRVAAVDTGEGRGPFSDPQEFRRVYPAPQLDQPDISDEYVVIGWRAGLPGQKYQFQLSNDRDFASPLIDSRIAEPKIQIHRPEPGRYFMRIRTIESDGFVGSFGPTQSMDVPRQGLYWWLLALPLFALFAL